MTERPKWLNVVGGKDHKPKTEQAPAQTSRETTEVTGSELVSLYKERKGNRPANFEASASKSLVATLAPGMRKWTPSELHGYLSQPDIWEKPSNTLAVFEEIRERLLTGSLEPRK